MKLFAILAMVAVLPLSCKKPATEPDGPDGPDGPDKPTPIETQAASVTLPSGGGDATLEITTTGDWTLEKDENYKWLTVTPESGAEGTATLTFSADMNDTGRERSGMFYVMQGDQTAYEILVSQPKNVIPLGEGDYAFLKQIVDNKYLGDSTPVVADWYAFTGEEFSGTGIELVNIDGVWYVCSISIDPLAISITGFPNTLQLPELEYFRIWDGSYGATLKGVEIPQDWKTPKLEYLCLSHTKMTGTIPQGLADSPSLAVMFLDDTDFYGALPHIWASKVLEIVMIGSTNNGSFKGDDPYDGDTECPYLGYMIPESLDVINITEIAYQNDQTQFKVGGIKEGHWLGFEKGWGQRRYESFDPEAVAGDKNVWSNYRLLIGNPDIDPDNVWLWYVSNLGFTPVENYKTHVPFELLDWDQTVADAFTAEAKRCHDAGIPIDMTKFGKEVEETPDDDIAPGNVITPEVDWTE